MDREIDKIVELLNESIRQFTGVMTFQKKAKITTTLKSGNFGPWSRALKALDTLVEVGDLVQDLAVDYEVDRGQIRLLVALLRADGEAIAVQTFPIGYGDEPKTAEEPSGPFKVKPALYRFPDLPWAWVRLSELAEIVDQTPAEIWVNFFALTKDVDKGVLAVAFPGDATRPFPFNAREIYHAWHVVDEYGWSLMFSEVDEKFILRELGTDVLPTRWDLGKLIRVSHYWLDRVFVPAGWAMDVLDAAEAGVVEVVEVHHEHKSDEDECPEGTLNCTFTGSDFIAAVGLKADGTPVTECDLHGHDMQLSQFPMEPCKCSVYYCVRCGKLDGSHIVGCIHDPEQFDTQFLSGCHSQSELVERYPDADSIQFGQGGWYVAWRREREEEV